jgi:hypothetical protein
MDGSARDACDDRLPCRDGQPLLPPPEATNARLFFRLPH